jgi:hypothetical protein
VNQPEGRVLEIVVGLFVVTTIIGGLGAAVCVPGTAVWLAIVARLSPEGTVFRRRTVAVLAGPPLIGLGWLVTFLSNPDSFPFAPRVRRSPAGRCGHARQAA